MTVERSVTWYASFAGWTAVPRVGIEIEADPRHAQILVSRHNLSDQWDACWDAWGTRASTRR